MEVGNGLTAVASHVGHQTVAGVRLSLVVGDRLGDVEETSPEVVLRRGQLGGADDVLAGEDEHVGRRLGVDVAEGDDLVVGVHDRSRDGPGGDPAEEAVIGHGSRRVARSTSPSTASTTTSSSPPATVAGPGAATTVCQ